jgi:hypothetical protein
MLFISLLSVGGAMEIASSQGERLVLAYYYSWFDANTWSMGNLTDTPLEPYASRDRATMKRHLERAKGAGIDALVQAWLGPDNPTDENFGTLLSVAEETGCKVCIGFETDSPFLSTQQSTQNALAYLMERYVHHPAYLKAEGRPVIFFWRVPAVPTGSTGSPLEAWEAIRAQSDPNREAIWISEGVDLAYLRAFDGHHLYSIAWSSNVAGTLSDWGNRIRGYNGEQGVDRLWVATVMPGYDDRATGRADAFVRDRQGGQFYRETWEAAMSSRPDWIIITSFNEWLEGSHIEPSTAYGDLYLNLTRELAAAYKSGEAMLPSPQGEEVAAPTATVIATATETATAVPSTSTTARTSTPTATLTPPPTATATSTPTSSPTGTATAAASRALPSPSTDAPPATDEATDDGFLGVGVGDLLLICAGVAFGSAALLAVASAALLIRWRRGIKGR